jgi:carbon monoxide dehydrogenase subunit G
MITITETITTTKPRPEVFAYLSDFTAVAEWDPGIASSDRTSGDGGVGSVYEVIATFSGREIPMTYEVLEMTPPERIVLRGAGRSVVALDTIECLDHNDGTRVVYTAEFRLKGVMRLVEPFLGGTFRRLGRTAIEGLARALNA